VGKATGFSTSPLPGLAISLDRVVKSLGLGTFSVPTSTLIGASLLLATVLLSGCVTDSQEGLIGVVVTLPPQKEMIEAVGGGNVRVTVMVPPGESPHTYAPIPSQMTRVAEAQLYLTVGSGVEFEVNYMDEMIAQNSDMKIVNCSKGIELLELEHNGVWENDHGGGKDPHIWLSPLNARQMVISMCEGLTSIDEGNRELYERNRDSYLSELDSLHSEIAGKLEGREGSSFLVFHPAWGYFAEAYGLVQLAIEEEGKAPGPSGVAAVIEQAKERDIKVVFVSPQFDKSSAETIAREIGGEVVQVDSLAGDYIENLREVAAKVSEGLSR
jgi:zinc transport system substrate-binding protein